MRTIYFLLAFPLLLGSCTFTKQEEKIDIGNVVIPKADHEYFEIQEYYINWNNILTQNMNTYYVYIFSLTCSHCNELKNWIIEKALERNDIFFIKGSNSDVLKSNVSDTIGATSINQIAIVGYPSLLKISNKMLVKNVAGNAKILDALK